MKLIDGRALAEKIKDGIARDIQALNGPRPGLAIILVGDRSDSKLYVSLKEKQSRAVGIDTHVYYCEKNIEQAELIQTIEFLNSDPAVDAILVQLPLPSGLDTHTVVNTILPEKDVDGFTQKNLTALMQTDSTTAIMPPVYAVVLTMISSINQSLQNKTVAVIANSDIFENNLAEVLRRQGAKVILVDNTEDNIGDKTKQADVIITAIGRAHYLTGDMIKPHTIIIDIGISTDAQGKICGDVDEPSVHELDGYLSPVPGGVGPMTIAMAFWNTLEMFKRHHKLQS